MPSIRINAFGGLKYKDKRGVGDTSRASIAKDVNLEHGDLQPWRYPAMAADTRLNKACTIYKNKCCWVASDNQCASFVHSDTYCNRLFSTEHKEWPAFAITSDRGDDCGCEEVCDLTWWRLGIPMPRNRPMYQNDPFVSPKIDMPETVSTYDCEAAGDYRLDDYVNQQDDDPYNDYAGPDDFCDTVGYANTDPWKSDAGRQIKKEPRSYVYTYVNEFGEESDPSLPSVVKDADVDSGANLQLNIANISSEGYKTPVAIRIYRGVPAQASPDSQESELFTDNDLTNYYHAVNSVFLFAKEIPFQEGLINVTDNTNAEDLGEALMDEHNKPPLSDLQNIQMLESGSLVASRKNELWFSEPWKFHSWNCFMNLDDCIINFKVVGSKIYVATNSHPYIINAYPEEVEDCKCCRSVNKLIELAPIASKRSMVITNSGVMWATNTGLVKLTGDAFKIETHSIMAEDDWQKWMPHHIHGEFYKGKYFGFNAERGFIFDIVDGHYAENYIGEASNFTELTMCPESVYKTKQNELYMSFDGKIHKWNSADTFMPYTWRSKLNVEGGLKNFSIMKVVFSDWLRTRRSPTPVVIRYFADDKLIFTRQVSCSRPFRLPKGFDALNFMIEVEGIEKVNEIHIATDKTSLINLNNS